MDDAKYPAFDTKPYRIVKSRSEASVPVNVTPTYYIVAKQCNTTPIGVDQAIRTAVNQTWQEQNIPVYCALMGRSPAPHEPRPTSCEFLANVLMYVRIQMAECHY